MRIFNDFSSNYIEYKGNGDKDKTLSIKDYLDEIKPYLGNIINDHKTQSELKIQLIMTINFISSKDSDEIRTMHTKSNNVEILIGNEINETIEEVYEPLAQRYQEGLEERMKGNEFIFDSVDALYYKLLTSYKLLNG